MNDIGIFGVFIQFTGYAIVETHTETDDQIGVHDGTIRFYRPVHPHHTQAQGMISRHRRQTMQREGNRDIGLFRQLLEHRTGITGDDAVPAEHDRSLAAIHHLNRLVDNFPLRRGMVVKAGKFRAERFRVKRVVLTNTLNLYIFGKIYNDRAETSSRRNVEGLVDCFFNLFSGQRHVGLLADRHHDTNHITFLESIRGDNTCCDLTGD